MELGDHLWGKGVFDTIWADVFNSPTSRRLCDLDLSIDFCFGVGRKINFIKHHINSCDPIYNIMEKRCIQFIWKLMNSDTILFNRTVKHSFRMSSTTLGENIRYFMFKYGIYMSEWYGPLSVLHEKIQKHILNKTSIVNKCTGIAIRELCNARDSNVLSYQIMNIFL